MSSFIRINLILSIKLLHGEDLKVKLSNSTEAELKALQSSLEASKAAAIADLQKNVYEK